jgi:uncharacterized alpha-E superfamily protein
MLSRVADALFWMGRYLERADHVARNVGVTFNLDLDLHGVLANPAELEWSSLLATLQQPAPVARDGEGPVVAVRRWLLYDNGNPGSVVSCVNRARNNARSIRGSISPPMWRELNKLYWQLGDVGFRDRAAESPHDFCEETQMGVALVHGVCDATLTHDEGWHFIQVGRFLERGDRVLRTLSSRFALLSMGEAGDLPVHLVEASRLASLLAAGDGSDLSVSSLQWAAVLKKCAAYEAYQRLYISRVEPERIVEFLLVNPAFPHSVRFCLTRVLESLAEIGGTPVSRCEGEPMRTVGRLVSDLAYLDCAAVDVEAVNAFLAASLQQCAVIGQLVQHKYSLQ